MAWSTPATWVAGAVLTAAQLNAQLRDNLNAAFALGVDGWTSYTPTLTQGATVTKTVTYAKYTRVGRTIIATFDLVATGAGTASNEVFVGLPVVGFSSSININIGQMLVYDLSLTNRYNGNAEMVNANAVAMSYNVNSASRFGVLPLVTLASGDIIRGTVTYEAAS